MFNLGHTSEIGKRTQIKMVYLPFTRNNLNKNINHNCIAQLKRITGIGGATDHIRLTPFFQNYRRLQALNTLCLIYKLLHYRRTLVHTPHDSQQRLSIITISDFTMASLFAAFKSIWTLMGSNWTSRKTTTATTSYAMPT